jgi:hypothetical protein
MEFNPNFTYIIESGTAEDMSIIIIAILIFTVILKYQYAYKLVTTIYRIPLPYIERGWWRSCLWISLDRHVDTVIRRSWRV